MTRPPVCWPGQGGYLHELCCWWRVATDFPVFLLLRNTADTRFIHQYSNIEIQRRGETEADLFNHLTKTATQ